MRPLLCSLALLVALLGGAHAQTAEAAKKPIQISGNLVKECSARVAKDFPAARIVGRFFPAKRRTFGLIAKLIDPGEPALLVVPVAIPSVLGGTFRGFVGCAYDIKNGELSFRKTLGMNFFPRRYKLEPGEQ